MTELIWISDWQIQCCGSEFVIGEVVTWPVFPWEGSVVDWGPVEITGTYDSHEDEPMPEVTGVVRRIRTASRSGSDAPVLEDVDAIEKWFGVHDEERAFRGWIVDLEVST